MDPQGGGGHDERVPRGKMHRHLSRNREAPMQMRLQKAVRPAGEHASAAEAEAEGKGMNQTPAGRKAQQG